MSYFYNGSTMDSARSFFSFNADGLEAPLIEHHGANLFLRGWRLTR